MSQQQIVSVTVGYKLVYIVVVVIVPMSVQPNGHRYSIEAGRGGGWEAGGEGFCIDSIEAGSRGGGSALTV